MVEIFPEEDWKPAQPSSSDHLWRYIDFTQFVSVLEKDALWYPRASEFFDSYEGALPDSKIKQIANGIPNHISNREDKVSRYYDALRNSTYVSCWHQRSGETAAMWQVYQNKGKEVAIRTTIGDFNAAIEEDSLEITNGLVKYINYDNPREFITNKTSPFFFKRSSFRHEEEFRSVVSDFDPPEGSAIDEDFAKKVADNAKPGVPIPVDKEKLINEVYISPVAGGWLEGLVEDVLKTHNMSDINVRASSLTENPFDNGDR
ncbi:uncharacterized protein HfgLR_21920 (plasmid) [Haloferax gibbonsii]|uniref:DUF2971 domain-containing protein n=1 Tax=Haloferax gibbonsii TaxID=35746 RepID=A0A871BLB8_HALGI|nr:hypothetical protein [Haloferax gibbonsii]QOS13596.1 uncharacterized protein HfgLR_21920 [Haloferax gibbonsii]